MQKSFIYIILLSFIAVSNPALAQTKTVKSTTTKKKKKEEYKLTDHLTGEVLLGNIAFWGDLTVSTKVQAGYKLNDRFSAGLGGKLFYNQFQVPLDEDIKITDFGGLLYARGKITDKLFLQAEYNITKFEERGPRFEVPLPGATKYYPAFGGGYYSGYNDWAYGIQLLFVPNSSVQEYYSILEYWVGFSYKF